MVKYQASKKKEKIFATNKKMYRIEMFKINFLNSFFYCHWIQILNPEPDPKIHLIRILSGSTTLLFCLIICLWTAFFLYFSSFLYILDPDPGGHRMRIHCGFGSETLVSGHKLFPVLWPTDFELAKILNFKQNLYFVPIKVELKK
jgi:hypothetical protein